LAAKRCEQSSSSSNTANSDSNACCPRTT
jgi:hypothetical protein